MDKKPKTKEVVHSLKERVTAEAKDKAHTAGIKSKDRVFEQVKEETTNQAPAPKQQSEPQSAESYATDRVEDTAQNIAENIAVTAERAVKYGVQKIREHRAEKQAAEAVEAEIMEETAVPELLDQPLLDQQNPPTPELPRESAPLPKDVASTPDGHSAPDTLYSKPTHAREEPLHRETFHERNAKSEVPPSDRIRQKQAPTVKEKSESPAAEVKSKVKVAREKSDIRMPRSRAAVVPVSDGTASAKTVKSTGQKTAPVSKAEITKTVSVEPPVSNTVPPRTEPIPVKSEPTSLPDQSAKPTKISTKKTTIKTHEREVRTPDTVAAKERVDVHPREIRREVKTAANKQERLADAPVAKSNKSEVSAATTPKGKDAASAKPTTVKKAPSTNVKKETEQNVKKRVDPQKQLGKSAAEKTVIQEKKPFSVDAQKESIKRHAPKQRQKTPPKLHPKAGLQPKRIEKPTVKTPPTGRKEIKQSASAAKNAHRSIKTLSESTGATEKAVLKTSKAAKKTAQTAKKAEERARHAAQATKKAAQKTVKAVVQAVKASAKAVTGLAELLGVSAPVVLLIIIVCLIAAIGGTCFGIFLSNDKSSGSEMTISQAITQLTTDYYDSITKFQGQYNYDELEVKGSTAINWKDVLTIYAVKYTNESDGFDVVTLDKKKLKKIKEILLDMNPCTGVVVEKIVPVTKAVTDSRGQKVTTTTYETQKVLIVTAVHVGATEQAKLYDFSKDAKGQVKELLSSDYDEMWNELIGSSGEIIISNSTHVPNFIFTWPLDGDYRISSGFGTRTDPINGVVKTHGGTDIAAAQGTPILAAADGVVEIAGYNAGGYGYYVKIAHGNGYETLYGHCSVLLVSTGQTVKQGQVIAKVGSTGHSTGPHLHFEVRYNGNKVNPMQFFK